MDTIFDPLAAYENSTQGYEHKAKIAYTIPQAVQASGLSRSSLYIAIAAGALHARKSGARTLILESDLRQFLQSLPRFPKRGANGEVTA